MIQQNTAEIISIGDEILIGQITNTNESTIAQQLTAEGITITRMRTVGDSLNEIIGSITSALGNNQYVTVTGGLGPTHDDITRTAVCNIFQCDLRLDQKTLDHIAELFKKRGFPVTERNRDQACVPSACAIIHNDHGTAPGYHFERNGSHLFVMPGVPAEMITMMRNYVIPFIRAGNPGTILHKTIRTTGIPESFLADILSPIDDLLRSDSSSTLAFLPSLTGVRLRITVKDSDRHRAERSMELIVERILRKAEQHVYALEDIDITEVIKDLSLRAGITISLAESCTGGLVSDRITNIPGSSSFFQGGVVAYSNSSKVEILGVSEHSIINHGAVSEQVALEMALGVRNRFHSTLSLSITGIAGPSGGSDDKPVGTVWIGFDNGKAAFAQKFTFAGSRRVIKERTAQAALDLLRKEIIKIPYNIS